MLKNNDFTGRLQLLVNHFGGGKNTEFGKLVGTSEANIRNYLNGRMPKMDFIQSVLESIEISCEWFLFGKGEMIRYDAPKSEDQSKKINVQEGNVYLVRRFEELVIENAQLKDEINALKSGTKQSFSVVSPAYIEKEIKSMFAAEPEQEKLKK